MKKLGHPSFVRLVDKEIQEKAAELPEDGVPPEVVQIFKEELGSDDAPLDSKLQPQKAATPCEALEHDIASAGAAFSTQRPRTVVAEGEARSDAHQADELALENMITELGSDGIRSGLQTFEVRAGNQLIDMFRSCYWAIAFCFLFKHATAEPDVVNTVATEEDQAKAISRRRKGNKDAPDVDIQAWAAATLRQAASQFRRDWNFAPALWNFLFRTRVNQQPNANAYIYVAQQNDVDGQRAMTPKEIEHGAQEIYRKLRQGVYVDVNNQNKAVNGDLSKLRYVPGLSAAAQKLLGNAEARTKNIPGTHAVRSTMRHQTHAYRVNYGLAIFITFSPSERDSTIMVRMARARLGDPAVGQDDSKAFYGRNKPSLTEEFFRLSPERLAEAGESEEGLDSSIRSSIGRLLNVQVGPSHRKTRHIPCFSCMEPFQELPDYDSRRALLARDPLACVYGFQVLVGLVFRHIFGLRFCPRCPDCAQSAEPCTDAFGSNATARGGVFGRIEAAYGSLECQKNGNYHLHGQFFVQCMHQFTPLSELTRLGKEPLIEMLRKYSDYSGHVKRMVYCDPHAWHDKQQEVEDAWPEYKQSTLMLDRPRHHQDHQMEANSWRTAYLADDVESLQMHKQHHVHMVDSKGNRQPLNHCRDPKDPTKCKAHFPRTKWLTEEPVLICPGLADQKDMPYKGKRSMLGLPWGPCNDPNLNGCHPALLAALRSNCDVQPPYRFPITADTHSQAFCQQNCEEKMPVWQLVKEAQTNQAAQAGYACDYQNKRLPIAVHKVKEWMKGQQHLSEELQSKKVGYVGARVGKRLITDCYGRGVVRGAVETCNLILKAGSHDPTAAESIKTAPVTDISLQYPLRLLKSIAEEKPWPKEPCKPTVDKRNPVRRKLTECPPWTMYGSRGMDPDLHGLSAYEFAMHFHIKQARHPYSLARQQEQPENFEAKLTDQGIEQVNQNVKKLRPGKDYMIREEGGDDWWPLGKGQAAQSYRHDWIVRLRRRPHIPVIFSAHSSRTTEEQAMRILILFFPWVNDVKDASPGVPFINHFWQSGTQDWSQALLDHASKHRFPTAAAKRYVMNFVFTYCLPREVRLVDGLEENSDNEDIVDELTDFQLDENDLLEATRTHVRGNGIGQPVAAEDTFEAPEFSGDENPDEQEAANPTRLYDMTMEMFRLSGAIWQQQEEVHNEDARQRHEQVAQSAASWIPDHEVALRSAKDSDNSAKKDGTGTGILGEKVAAAEARVGN